MTKLWSYQGTTEIHVEFNIEPEFEYNHFLNAHFRGRYRVNETVKDGRMRQGSIVHQN